MLCTYHGTKSILRVLLWSELSTIHHIHLFWGLWFSNETLLKQVCSHEIVVGVVYLDLKVTQSLLKTYSFQDLNSVLVTTSKVVFCKLDLQGCSEYAYLVHVFIRCMPDQYHFLHPLACTHVTCKLYRLTIKTALQDQYAKFNLLNLKWHIWTSDALR